MQLAWTAGSNNTRFGIGAKYQLDKDSSLSVRADLSRVLHEIRQFLEILEVRIHLLEATCQSEALSKPSQNIGLITHLCLCFFSQAKVDNACLVGVGYTQTLRPGRLVEYLTFSNGSLIAIVAFAHDKVLCSLSSPLRSEAHPLRPARREEHERWRAQSRLGFRAGGIKECQEWRKSNIIKRERAQM